MAKDKPYYPNASIASIDILAKCLGVSPKVMLDLASKTESSYTEFLVSSKSKDRTVYEPKFELKKLQKRINARIFAAVQFPGYLQGGIKDSDSPRDYVRNGKCHAGSNMLVSLDIRNFYDNIKRESVEDIFRNFFRFSPEVCSVLTDIVTLKGKVPQGACTSSYIANLVFHNTEYSVVSYLRSRGITYTRLLDDVTLSSKSELSDEVLSEIIFKVSGMFKKHKLRIHPGKKKIEIAKDSRSEYKVTGVWVGHGVPKLRRKERDYIRHLVYICEQEYKKDPSVDSYHELWNRTSAHVATMTRMEHSQAVDLRERMSKILPVFGVDRKTQVIVEANKLLRRDISNNVRIGVIKTYNKTMHSLGILSRTDRAASRYYKRALRRKFSGVKTIQQFWEE
ncbi:reverse transcriptase family protein [Pseudomonas sp. PDM33]|uniref:reverse transcriptase family protein n=1 Tax=Pseudomonas sp. PDM33 TaxID=2854765 RepID=UPI001C47FACE|nr:reverse transcriptase family protein [Pseudomonas sp. PDM33]MBV7582454.1 reverse transcriptase family protein [Pseudomonas sp. PDM33]